MDHGRDEDRGNARGRRRPEVTPGGGIAARAGPTDQAREHRRALRRLLWLQVLLGWLPLWALFTVMILTAHDDVSAVQGALIGLRLIAAAVILAVPVQRLVDRLAWPHPFRVRFAMVHVVAALLFAATWVLVNSVIESLVRRQAVLVLGYGLGPYLVLGVWLYLTIVGVAYSSRAAERAARAEANAVRSQLATLRSQLNPHFLFNALHTVVQLIPREPARAAQAAELVADILRTSIEENRDLIALEEELAFVDRYLAVEHIRFGERLRVHREVSDEALRVVVPSFAVQTLVENAVRHGAAPRVEPTDVAVTAWVSGDMLVLNVADTGAGTSVARVEASDGSGLARLRQRLSALYGARASVAFHDEAEQGFAVTLRIPVDAAD